LYLFAAADCDGDGILPGFLYENPIFVSGSWHLRDYALLYAVTLCDYYLHTGDKETFLDVYPVAKRQMDAIFNKIDENGIVSDKSNIFIDWKDGLEKTTCLQGVYLYALKSLCKTLEALGHGDAEVYNTRYENAREAALRHLYNSNEDSFANEYDNNQISVHAAVWMILGGVVDGERGWQILEKTMNSVDSLKPVTPYMNHYLVEAMFELGRKKEAAEYIKSFWGLMVKEGADTFYEVFVPGKPELSPYGDSMVNSRCHAWSCTPSYFIRRFMIEK
jgi:hypothetical protein